MSISALARVSMVLPLVVAPLLGETWVSRRHETALRRRGAVEPPGDVYRAMVMVYPVAFLAIIAEGAMNGTTALGSFLGGVTVLVAAKALKYWAIRALGQRWCFRVLVPPGGRLVASGPYRYLRHPNYVAVMGEIVGVAIAMRAPLSGTAAAILFGGLIVRRVRVEEEALKG